MSIMNMFKLSTDTRTANALHLMWRDGELDLDPPYQRDHVWGLQRQQNLIFSLAMGIPVGAVFLNDRGDVSQPFVVVDGKQRITAINQWMTSQLSVPAQWFEGDLEQPSRTGQVVFSDLNRAARSDWKTGRTLAVCTSNFTGASAVETEKKLFDLINFGGVPQGQTDL